MADDLDDLDEEDGPIGLGDGWRVTRSGVSEMVDRERARRIEIYGRQLREEGRITFLPWAGGGRERQ